MEQIISFLSNVALVTAGILAMGFWIALAILVAVEVVDNRREAKAYRAMVDAETEDNYLP